MSDIMQATLEIRSFVFAIESVARNTEGRDPDDVGFTLAILSAQINERCQLIDDVCREVSTIKRGRKPKQEQPEQPQPNGAPLVSDGERRDDSERKAQSEQTL